MLAFCLGQCQQLEDFTDSGCNLVSDKAAKEHFEQLLTGSH